MPRRASADNVLQLTKANVATLAPIAGQGERIVWDLERRGLGVRIRPSGARSWVIRPPRNGGASKLHTLGSVDAISLSSARLTAEGKLAEAAGGVDPTKAKAEARRAAATTFGSLIESYIDEKVNVDGRRHSTIRNMKNHLNSHWRPLHDRPVSAITREEFAKRHREIVTEHGVTAAHRARSILSTFFAWCWRNGYVEANPIIKAHKPTEKTRRERTLDDREIAAVWNACRDDDFGVIIKLLVLTGQRRSEVAGIARSEIDLSTGIWTLPKSRSKNHKAHDVPLSAPVLATLTPLIERGGKDLLFGDGAGPFSGFSKAKAALDQRLAGAVTEWTIHDLRRSTATGMARIGISIPTIEKILNHVSGTFGGIVGVYQRHGFDAEKRQALYAWATHVETLTAKNGG